MKQAASILLLFLLAFNWVGYRMITAYMEHNADLALETRLDEHEYNATSLIEIRVPLNAPYLSHTTTDFERVDGEIELQGVLYKYVKRKVEKGELVLLCIPDEQKTRIQNSRVDFFKLVNDLNNTSDTKSKQASSIKNITTDYQQENNAWSIPAIESVSPITYPSNAFTIAHGYKTLPKQPPKA